MSGCNVVACGSHTEEKGKTSIQIRQRQEENFLQNKTLIPEDAGGREKNRKCTFLGLHDRALMQDIDASTLTEAKNGCLFSERLPR